MILTHDGQVCMCCTQNEDKSGWPDGPWKEEPNRVEFDHAGLPCLLHRNRVGAWCGYAAVPPGHPMHGRSYDDPDVRVHGGLTYADKCDGCVCHVAKPGEPDDVWWFGFDCAHGGDLCPANEHLLWDGDSYRDIDYARRETESLAEQLSVSGV